MRKGQLREFSTDRINCGHEEQKKKKGDLVIKLEDMVAKGKIIMQSGSKAVGENCYGMQVYYIAHPYVM